MNIRSIKLAVGAGAMLCAVLALTIWWGSGAARASVAEACAGGPPPVNGYSCETTTNQYITATNYLPPTILRGNLDEGFITTTLPFRFRFFSCEAYTQTLTVATNGFVQLNGYNSGTTYNWPEQPLPDEDAPNQAIYGLWADLDLRSSGGIYTDVVGTAPNRKFVIEWRDVAFFNGTAAEREQAKQAVQPRSLQSTGTANFEIVLEEGTNRITVNYGTITPGEYSQPAVAGIQAYVYSSYNSEVTAYQYRYAVGSAIGQLSGTAVAYNIGLCLPYAEATAGKYDRESYVRPGQPLTYTLFSETSYARRNDPLLITDTLPPDLTDVGCDAGVGNNCTISGTTAIYSVTNRSNSNYASVYVTLTGRVATTVTHGTLITNTMQVNFPATTTTYLPAEAMDVNAVLVPPRINITVTDDLTTAQRGDVVTYTVSYANVETETLRNLSLDLRLPVGTRALECRQPNQTFPCYPGYPNYGDPRPLVRFNLLPLRGREVASVTVRARLSLFVPAGSVLSTTAEIGTQIGYGGLLVAATANDSTTLVVPDRPLLLLDKSLNNEYYYGIRPGERITYTLAYTNIGGMAAYSTTLQDVLPPGLGGIVCVGRNVSTCTVGGGFASYTISSTISQTASNYLLLGGTVLTPTNLNDTTLTNTLRASYRDAGGQNYQAAAAVATNRITVPPSFEITHTDGVRFVSPGQVLTYSVVVTNNGIVPVADYAFHAALPYSTTYLSCRLENYTPTLCFYHPGDDYGYYRTPDEVYFFVDEQGRTEKPVLLPGQNLRATVAVRVVSSATNALRLRSYGSIYAYNGSGVGATAYDTDIVEIGPPTTCTRGFSDVPEGSIFEEYISFLTCRNVIGGFPDGSFHPNDSTTRGQFAKIAVLAFGIAAYTPTSPTFNDVPSSNTFYQYIEAAAHAGVINGYPGGSYRPSNNVTRGEAAKIVKQARNLPDLGVYGSYSDLSSSSPFYIPVNTLTRLGVVTGANCTNGSGTPVSGYCYRPNDPVRRGEMAKMVNLGVVVTVPPYLLTPTSVAAGK